MFYENYSLDHFIKRSNLYPLQFLSTTQNTNQLGYPRHVYVQQRFLLIVKFSLMEFIPAIEVQWAKPHSLCVQMNHEYNYRFMALDALKS